MRLFTDGASAARILTREAMAQGITGALLAHLDQLAPPYGASSAGWINAAMSADDVRGALRIPAVFEEREDLGLRWRPNIARAIFKPHKIRQDDRLACKGKLYR